MMRKIRRISRWITRWSVFIWRKLFCGGRTQRCEGYTITKLYKEPAADWCKRWDRPAEYPVNKRFKTGYSPFCAPCELDRQSLLKETLPKRREQYDARLYNVSGDWRAITLEAQNGSCAICAATLALEDTRIDHDHACCPKKSCGKCVRGLLCNSCNTGLGNFRDDPILLIAAAEYITSYRIAA
jgi:hypothetical protein